MYKMAVVGDYDSIYGFAALGLDTFPADGPEKLEQVFHNLVSGGYAVIYMTEAAAAQISRTVERYRESLLPEESSRVKRAAFGRQLTERWVKPSNEQRCD